MSLFGRWKEDFNDSDQYTRRGIKAEGCRYIIQREYDRLEKDNGIMYHSVLSGIHFEHPYTAELEYLSKVISDTNMVLHGGTTSKFGFEFKEKKVPSFEGLKISRDVLTTIEGFYLSQ